MRYRPESPAGDSYHQLDTGRFAEGTPVGFSRDFPTALAKEKE
jgi:hypothetical protein